ncbi:MAG: hypothetical protein GY866_36465 [Proteobacteria bacterium]|nr:hypothetical protein [Pseudomonadota bacterium]
MNVYYILSAFHADKYELRAAVNEAGILVVDKIEKIETGVLQSLVDFGKRKRQLLNKIQLLKDKGFIVIVEEAVENYSVGGTTRRSLTDRFNERLSRDVYFEYFLNMYPQQLHVPEEYTHNFPKEGSNYEVLTDDKGRVSYRFRHETTGEFRAILLLISAYVNRPMDISMINEMFAHDNKPGPPIDNTIQALSRRGAKFSPETDRMYFMLQRNYMQGKTDEDN